LGEKYDNDSQHAHDDFHGSPGAKGFGDGHSQVLFDYPETGIIHVGDGGAAAADRENEHFWIVSVKLLHERGKNAGSRDNCHRGRALSSAQTGRSQKTDEERRQGAFGKKLAKIGADARIDDDLLERSAAADDEQQGG